ncbi:MAG: hypothetical protein IKQ70_09525 [Bacteroidales bacterium]|nr:hypothetical protein [Bacteroidales bacterium]
MKINDLNIEEIIKESKKNFGKLSRASLYYYGSYVLLLIIVFFIMMILRPHHSIKFLIGVSIIIVLVIGYLSTFTNIYKIYSRFYKKTILLPILQKIDGFVNYYFKSRDYRIQSLSHNSTDNNEDVMVFRRNHFTLFCSEFSTGKEFYPKLYPKYLLMKFVLDKPIGEQVLIALRTLDNSSAYFSNDKYNFGCQHYNCFSLFEHVELNDDISNKLKYLLISIFNIWLVDLRLVLDNDVICVYAPLKKDNFELGVTDYDYEERIESDFKILKQILATTDELNSFTDCDLAIDLSIPSEDKKVEDELSSYVKSYTAKISHFARVGVLLSYVIFVIIAFVLMVLLYFYLEEDKLIEIWMTGSFLLSFYLGIFMSRILNRIVVKRIFKTICKCFNRTFTHFKFRKRRNKKDKDTKSFRYFDYDYLRQHSIECQFSNYNLYLFGDDNFNGTLMEFKYNTKLSEVVQLVVRNREMKIVECSDNTVIDPEMKNCIMAVADYLSVFNPYLTLNVVLRPDIIQIYVPSSGYIDLSMDLFEAPDYELTAQNAVQISRMIRAADKFVDTYNRKYF